MRFVQATQAADHDSPSRLASASIWLAPQAKAKLALMERRRSEPFPCTYAQCRRIRPVFAHGVCATASRSSPSESSRASACSRTRAARSKRAIRHPAGFT